MKKMEVNSRHRKDAQSEPIVSEKIIDIKERSDVTTSTRSKATSESFFPSTSWKFKAFVILSLLILVPYLIFQSIKAGSLDPDVRNKVMVVYSMPNTYFTEAQGMFSEYFHVLGALQYAETHGARGVKIKFDYPSFYTRKEGDNWWSYYFESEMLIGNGSKRISAIETSEALKGYEEVHINFIFGRYGRYGSFSPIIYGKNFKFLPWPLSYGVSPKKVVELNRKYIHLIDKSITDRVDNLIKSKSSPGDFLIGLHYRGTDKVEEFPYKTVSPEVWAYYIEQVVNYYQIENFKLLAATDSVEFITWLEKKYPGKAIYFDDNPRISLKDQTGAHKTASISPKIKGDSAILDCSLLTRSHYLIKNRSSLSSSVLSFSEKLLSNFTTILGSNVPVHSTPHFPSPPKDVWVWNEEV